MELSYPSPESEREREIEKGDRRRDVAAVTAGAVSIVALSVCFSLGAIETGDEDDRWILLFLMNVSISC